MSTGTDGNELLTTGTGVVLVVVLAVVGVTIVRIGQLLWEHLFFGLLVIGPVVLKLASTGYRFMRYYTGDPAYVSKGPPWLPLRLLAPAVVLTTLAVLATGLVLLFAGPSSRDPWVLIHKVSFIAWIVVTALHVLGHLPEVRRLIRVRDEIPGLPGTGGRMAGLAGALVAGVILAVALIPEFHAWTAAQPFFHHHHHFGG